MKNEKYKMQNDDNRFTNLFVPSSPRLFVPQVIPSVVRRVL
jgi:hypothetical protein